ncbi:MAG: ATP-grasp domain-containing protein, partial [Propionibacteriaceae bacterium]|nr:ATP-grasp domain-containing protein [Propionibacteriaceae bacterium]
IDLAEDRGEFGKVLAEAGLLAPEYGLATSVEEALQVAHSIGFPVLVRPSYVLGGRGMEIVYDDASLAAYIERATHITPTSPVLVDRFLDDAIEIDVDALYDGQELYLGGVMEHIEEAGIHSGDSACALPPITLGSEIIDLIRYATERIAAGVGVRGLINIQFALHGDSLYVLEANPRASRTVPFVSKATSTALAKAAALISMGATISGLREQGKLRQLSDGAAILNSAPMAVKEAVMPFNRFRTADGSWVDSLLGPEMKSTGEVMGLDLTFGKAFAKSQAASYGKVPTSGTIFVSAANRDKRHAIFPVKHLADLGFRILATEGTAQVLRRNDVEVEVIRKATQGRGPNDEGTIVDAILNGEVDLIFNTPQGISKGGSPRRDGWQIRSAAILADVPCVTTVQGLSACVQGIEALRKGDVSVRSLQSWNAAVAAELSE